MKKILGLLTKIFPKLSKLEAILNGNSSSSTEEIVPIKKYLGILDSYGVSWTLEKAARDTLQNFFDGNNHTLDGIEVELDRQNIFNHFIRIQNSAVYDYRKLLHLGGTTKSEETLSAGGIGEGAKVLALVLLRDYGFSQVRFGSKNWLVDFTLDDLSEEEYTEKRKGLFASVAPSKKNLDGNFIEFIAKSKNQAEAFRQAKDLFYHSENPDFQNPTLIIPNVGGFKFLGGKEKNGSIPKGNFYFAGQRRHVEGEEWNNLENISLWTYSNEALRRDRDRGLITKKEFLEQIVPSIFSKAPIDELQRVIYDIQPIWTEIRTYDSPIGPKVLEYIAKFLERKNIKMNFEDKYLAHTWLTPDSIEEALKTEGYVICNENLSRIGMKTVMEKYHELQEHYRAEPTPEESEKMKILYRTIKAFKKNRKDIWIFDRENERSIIEGQYNENFVWLSRQVLKKDFAHALAIYLHELDHVHGSDVSSSFSYALTDTLGEVIHIAAKKPEYYQKMHEQWSEI